LEKYYNKSWGEVVEELGTNINKGLMEYECILKREIHGDNSLIIPRKNKIDIILKESLNKEIVILEFLLLTSFLLSKNYWLLIIGFICMFLNLFFNLNLNLKRYRNLTSLIELNRAKVVVLREGVERIVEAHELMIGDIVVFKKGSFISADLRIIWSDGLKVDECSVTGEEFLKDKYETKIDYQIAKLGEINNMLFRGSIVKAGEGRGIVTEIGNRTELGKILLSLENKKPIKSNIINNAYYQLSKIKFIVVIVSILLYIIIPGSGQVKINVLNNSFFITIILCCPIIISMYSNFIKNSLKDKGIDILNISALDDSKLVKLLFIEKIGSITKKELNVKSIYSDEIYTSIENIDINNINIRRVIDIAYFNSDIYPNIKDKVEDMLSLAYISSFESKGIDRQKSIIENKFKFRVGRDSQKQIVSTVTKNSRGYRVNSRGNLEEILQRSEFILINGIEHPLTNNEISKIKNADLKFSREGLITEAVAYRSFTYEPSVDENIESHLVFVGLIALENPYVEGLEEQIEELFDEGVLPIVFSDDNKIVGEVIGRKIGTVSSMNEVTSGVELSYMNNDEFYKTLSKTRVFCRTTPEQKNRIIDTYNKDGYKIAVEGEDLGDLSSISTSQIGITKGKANKLLVSVSDFYTRNSSIRALLQVREKSKVVSSALSIAGYMYIQFLLGQIFNLFNFYFIDDGVLLSLLSMILLNIVFLTPLILLAMRCGTVISRNKNIIYMFIYILTSMIIVPIVEENTEFVLFTLLSLNMLITVFLNIKINLKSWSADLKLLIITICMFLICSFIIYYYMNVVINTVLVLILLIVPIIYLILIYIIRRWQ
jgi:magnesium-transporting ATPase (P-type)